MNEMFLYDKWMFVQFNNLSITLTTLITFICLKMWVT